MPGPSPWVPLAAWTLEPAVLEGYSRAAKPEALQNKAKPRHLPQGEVSPPAGLQPPQAIRTFPSPPGEKAAVVKGGHKDSPRLVGGGGRCLLVPGEMPGWWRCGGGWGKELFLP